MKRINLNIVAVNVSKKEKFRGTKRKGKEMSIGDIKECQRLTFEELVNNYESIDILNMLERYRK